MTILLLGSTGQVGFELHRALAPLGRVIAPLRYTIGHPLFIQARMGAARRVFERRAVLS